MLKQTITVIALAGALAFGANPALARGGFGGFHGGGFGGGFHGIGPVGGFHGGGFGGGFHGIGPVSGFHGGGLRGAPHFGPGPVIARGHGGGNGHHHGNGHRHRHGHRGHGAFFAYFGVPFYDGFYNAYAYDGGCYRPVRVLTRHHGWRWRRVNVCYYGN